jgi:hypothetical protein
MNRFARNSAIGDLRPSGQTTGAKDSVPISKPFCATVAWDEALPAFRSRGSSGKGGSSSGLDLFPHQLELCPPLNKIPTHKLVKEIDLSRSANQDIKASRSRPDRKNQELLAAIVQQLAAI